MRLWISRFYCKFSGLWTSLALIIIFFSSFQTHTWWTQIAPATVALVLTLATALGVTALAYIGLTRFNLWLLRHLPPEQTSCRR